MRNLFYHPLPYGSIIISGADRSAFLQRQVTNDMKLLKPGTVLPAALTAPTGKMIDLFLLIERGESIEAIALAGKTGETTRYMKSRVFFMDKVSLNTAEISRTFAAVWGEGLEKIFPAGENLLTMQVGGHPVEVIHPVPGLILGALLLTPAEALPSLAEIGIYPADVDAYETARVSAGVPGIPELRGEYTPFELQLDKVVSSTKGCFTGQEVLVRQVTYDKITKRLCVLRLDGEAPAAAKVIAGAAPVGEVTSSNGKTALAVLRRPHFEQGTKVSVRWEDNETSGEVVSLLSDKR